MRPKTTGTIHDEFYCKVSPDQIERLKRFRSTHPYKHLVIGGVTWKYVSCGQGEEALLLLTGGTGIGEAMALVFTALENKYRIISPTYPLVATIEQLVDGIVGILESEGIHKVNLLGQSFGGMLAQVMVRKYPEEVNKLILSHTLTTSPPAHKAIILERQEREKSFLKLLPLLPLWMIRLVTRKRLSTLISMMNTEEKEFWEAYLREMISCTTKEHFVSNLKCGLDFCQNYIFSRDDLANWSGKILILESDNDISHLSEREAIRGLYPQAQVHTFQGTGHLTIIVNQEEFLSVVSDFLEE